MLDDGSDPHDRGWDASPGRNFANNGSVAHVTPREASFVGERRRLSVPIPPGVVCTTSTGFVNGPPRAGEPARHGEDASCRADAT